MTHLTDVRDFPQAVIVRLPNWVGDVCMCLPVLSLLGSLGIPYAVCARPWARELLGALPLQDFIPMSGKIWADAQRVRAWRHAHPAFRLGLLLPDSLSGVRSAGYRDDGRGLLLDWSISKPGRTLHAVQSWYALACEGLRHWGYGPDLPPVGPDLSLPLLATQDAQARERLAQSGLTPRQFVLVAPTATGLHHGQVKVWPHFDALVRALQDGGRRVVMCPPPAEQLAARLAAPTAELLDPLPIGAFAALASHASLVICNDSGVSHLSAAVGARQLTLFGVTSPERTGPWTPHSTNLGQNGHWPAAEAVIARAQQLLESPGP